MIPAATASNLANKAATMNARHDKNSAILFLQNAGYVAKIGARAKTLHVYQGDRNDPGSWMELDVIAIDDEHTVSAAAVAAWVNRPLEPSHHDGQVVRENMGDDPNAA